MKILYHKSKKGFTTLAALLTLLSLMAMGGVIAFLAASGQESRINHLTSVQAFYVTQAGIEYALRKKYEGGSDVISPAVNFGEGSFQSSKSGIILTVTGTVGNAVRSYKIDSPTESDCFDVDVNSANLVDDDTRITNILTRKSCGSSITIDKMTLTWENLIPVATLIKIRIENSNVYNDPSGGTTTGNEIDITNYTIDNEATHVITFIEWNNAIDASGIVNITFTMTDDSTKTVTVDFD